jgi:hypothetical protein
MEKFDESVFGRFSKSGLEYFLFSSVVCSVLTTVFSAHPKVKGYAG